MRILQLIDVYKTGGAEKVFDNFSLYCKSKNIISECYVLYKSDYNEKLPYFLMSNENSIFRKLLQQVKAIKKLKSKIKSSGVDRIVSFLDRSNIIAVCACARKHVRVTVTIHNPPTIQYRKLGILRYLVFIILRHFYNKSYVSVIGVSLQVKESLEEIGVRNVRVVYNPIAENNNSYSDIQLKEPYFINIGRLSYQKAQWKLIKAIHILKTTYNISVSIVIVGEGELEANLKQLTKELALQNNVIFTGYVKNPTQLIRKSLCMIFSSFYEGFPITVLEAFKFKIPVIGTRVSLPKDVRSSIPFEQFYYDNCCMEENFNPVLFDKDDYKLAELMKFALENEDQLKQIAEIGNRWVFENCGLENFKEYFV
ncbi:MAG: glycosyltransferase [Treponema sp.]|nr:glycosyltransferase [Treponema sp.]